LQVSGRTVLLTGATGGIGHAIARTLAGRGARLILTGRRADLLEELAAELPGTIIAPADLADPGAVRSLATAHPNVDVVVSNAGLPGSGPLVDYTEEQIDRVLAVNLRAPVMLARAFVPEMVRHGSGHIVLMSSLLDRAPMPGSVLYNLTKSGLRSFGASLRMDLRGTGVGVSVVSPAFVGDAGMFADSGASLPRGVRLVTAREVADAIVSAVESDRAEVLVAPLSLKVGATVAAVVPHLAARVAGWLGGDELAETMAEKQADKR
jgi:short-subunit dehydrogenase